MTKGDFLKITHDGNFAYTAKKESGGFDILIFKEPQHYMTAEERLESDKVAKQLKFEKEREQ